MSTVPNDDPDSEGEGPAEYGDIRLEWIAAGELKLAPEYNRPLRPGWVQHLAKTWDRKKLGVLFVSRRADGHPYVISGQHRREGCLLRGKPREKLPCIVFDCPSLKEEASLFHALDALRLRHSSGDQYRGRLLIEDTPTLQVEEAVTGAGLRVQGADNAHQVPEKYRIGAVSSLYTARRIGGQAGLREALGFLRQAWADDPEGLPLTNRGTPISPFSQMTIAPMTLFLARAGRAGAPWVFDPKGFTKRLRRAGLAFYLREINKRNSLGGGGGTSALRTGVGVLLKIYNRNIPLHGRHRLPDYLADSVRDDEGEAPGGAPLREGAGLHSTDDDTDAGGGGGGG